jgi:predicted DNA-binding protein
MNSMPRLTFQIPENLEKRLDKVTTDTGLNKSEIARRGTLEQIKDLEVDEQ